MDEEDEVGDYELPYPPEGWWHATLGVALRDAYSGYEHGIAYFGLDDCEPPRKSELDLAQWQSLRQARRTGIAVVDAVRSLVTRSADAVPTLPPRVEDAQNIAIQRALWMMSREDLSRELPEPPDSIEHPSTSQYLLATTIVLGITQLLPGIKWEPLDYGFGYTSVNTDRVLVGRVRTLLRHVRADVPERTARYLSSIARCYLFSLDAEMVSPNVQMRPLRNS